MPHLLVRMQRGDVHVEARDSQPRVVVEPVVDVRPQREQRSNARHHRARTLRRNVFHLKRRQKLVIVPSRDILHLNKRQNSKNTGLGLIGCRTLASSGFCLIAPHAAFSGSIIRRWSPGQDTDV